MRWRVSECAWPHAWTSELELLAGDDDEEVVEAGEAGAAANEWHVQVQNLT